jgi:hypothetical protein
MDAKEVQEFKSSGVQEFNSSTLQLSSSPTLLIFDMLYLIFDMSAHLS